MHDESDEEIMCGHCGGKTIPGQFCEVCKVAASTALMNVKESENKNAPCFHCLRSFLIVTLKKNGGFCGHCVNSVKIRTPPSGSEVSGNVAKTKATIPKALRQAVWKTYIGGVWAEYKCYCCGVQPMDVWSFHCGHVQAESLGGPTNLANLRPICQICNNSMATKNMQEFVRECGFNSKMKKEIDGALDEDAFVVIERDQPPLGRRSERQHPCICS